MIKTQITDIKAFRWEDGTTEICLAVPNKVLDDVPSIKDILKNGKKVEVEVKQVYTKRSLDSNAYLWVLCDKIAEQIQCSKEEVYQDFIKHYGCFEIFPVKDEAVESAVRRWNMMGLGWCCETLGKSKLPNYTNVIFYYGSSTYDSKEMSRLLEQVVAEAKRLGIQTLTPQEIEMLNKSWEARYEKHFTNK